MSYTITKYSRKRAAKLGVKIRPSKNPSKKLDVYRGTKKVASIGASGYGDYPTFMRTEGMASAKAHRRKYKMRHEKDRHVRGTPGFYADQILW
jgi:hypothetical protein